MPNLPGPIIATTTAVNRNTEQLRTVGEGDRDHHVEGDDQATDACVEPHDYQQRGEHFTDEHAISKETRQAMPRHHALDAADAVTHLGDAVQQHQDAQRQAQYQFADVVVHGVFSLWMSGFRLWDG
jgi:hypothetical protein